MSFAGLPVSGAMIVLAVTLGVSLFGLLVAPKLIGLAVFRPYWLLRNREWLRLVTSGLVHADLGHLFFNLFTYYFFAFPLERRIGTPSFLMLYLAGLVLSELGTWIRHRDDPEYRTLGASGAILAVLFAYIVYFPGTHLFILPIPIPIPAPLFAVAYLAYSFYRSRSAGGRINHDAHWGGALTGLAFVAVTDPGAYARLLGMLQGQ